GRLHRIVGGKQLFETGHVQELSDALGGVDQDQLPFRAAEAPQVAHQLTDTRRIDVVDAGEVDDDVATVVRERALQGLGEKLRAFGELDDPFHIEKGESFELAFFDDHLGWARLSGNESLARARDSFPIPKGRVDGRRALVLRFSLTCLTSGEKRPYARGIRL